MPTREPMFWMAPIVAGLISGSGGGLGSIYLWQGEPEKDPVLEYRVSQCELRGNTIMRELTEIKAKIAGLPPQDWRTRIFNIEIDVRKISDAMIRLEQHGHPELQYEGKE